MLHLSELPVATPSCSCCSYVNLSSHIQIVRLFSDQAERIERVIFPQQQFTFIAPLTAQLEIYSGQFVTALLEARIPCSELSVSGEVA